MLPEIVTLAEAKNWLRYTDEETHEDDTIGILIAAATEYVLSIAAGWDRTRPPPATLKLAVLAHVGRAFDNRDEGTAAPDGADRLVQPHRVLGV